VRGSGPGERGSVPGGDGFAVSAIDPHTATGVGGDRATGGWGGTMALSGLAGKAVQPFAGCRSCTRGRPGRCSAMVDCPGMWAVKEGTGVVRFGVNRVDPKRLGWRVRGGRGGHHRTVVVDPRCVWGRSLSGSFVASAGTTGGRRQPGRGDPGYPKGGVVSRGAGEKKWGCEVTCGHPFAPVFREFR